MGDEHTKSFIIESGNIPAHVAIIMDGNGRWARSRDHSRVEGHKEGINSVREIVRAAGEIGVSYLTLYTFSTENWSRPKSEVAALMRLLLNTIRSEVDDLAQNNVRLKVLGRLSDLPSAARFAMEHAVKRLQNNTGLTLNLALSYSSRREITDSVYRIARKVAAGEINIEDIDEDLVTGNLYTADIPDPDLLIRTSGELRLSNFLLWQLAYTEIFVSNFLWPDFRRTQFFEAIRSYQSRERRFGKVSEQVQVERLEAVS